MAFLSPPLLTGANDLSQREIDLLTGWDLSFEQVYSNDPLSYLPPIFNQLGEKPLCFKTNIKGSQLMDELFYPAFFGLGEGIYFSFNAVFTTSIINDHLGLTLNSLQFTALETGILQSILGNTYKISHNANILEPLTDEAVILCQTFQARDNARVSFTIYTPSNADLTVSLTSFPFETCLIGEVIKFPLDSRFQVAVNNEKKRLFIENDKYYLTKEIK